MHEDDVVSACEQLLHEGAADEERAADDESTCHNSSFVVLRCAAGSTSMMVLCGALNPLRSGAEVYLRSRSLVQLICESESGAWPRVKLRRSLEIVLW